MNFIILLLATSCMDFCILNKVPLLYGIKFVVATTPVRNGNSESGVEYILLTFDMAAI